MKLAGAGGLAIAAPTLASPALLTGTARAAAREWKVTGKGVASVTDPFDAEMQTFMQKYGITGGQVAVVRNNKLLAARGYSWSENTAFEVKEDTLFRIASLSKPIAAVGAMAASQDSDLNVLAKLTDLVDMTPPPGQTPAAGLDQINMLRLMRHEGGWDRDISGDPVGWDLQIARDLGVPLPITREQNISYAASKALDHTPGSKHAYSNYGYMLLGKAMEHQDATGQPYAQYIQQRVLGPMGITRMRPAQTLVAAPGEVTSYTDLFQAVSVLQNGCQAVPAPANCRVPSPYGGFNLAKYTGFGEWLASAVDYIRFIQIMGGQTPVLSSGFVDIMKQRPESDDGGDTYYGCGWSVRPTANGHNIWHSGGLRGTRTYAVRYASGLSWVMTLNSGRYTDPADNVTKYYSAAEIENTIEKAITAVGTWPDFYDLFSFYFD